MRNASSWLFKLLLVGLVAGCSDRDSDAAPEVEEPPDCGADQTLCGQACETLTSDPENCGECGNACATGQSCLAGVCVCPTGQALCGAQCLGVTSDPQNCGACGEVCAADRQCAGGICQCLADLTDCSGECVNLQVDGDNCGDCAAACPTGHVCADGACASTCPPDTTQCGTSCVDPSSDPLNCGGCGVICPSPRTCSNGSCSCPAGTLNCAGQCIDTSTDVNNCGACGAQCVGAGAICSDGSCACPVGQLYCGGACVDPLTDPSNCGDCFTQCTGGVACVNGSCGGVGTGGAGTGGVGTGGVGTGGVGTGGAGTGGAGTGGAGTGGAGTGGDAIGGSAGTTIPGCAPPTEYPNLFVTLSGHTQEETDTKIDAAWNQLYNPSNPNTVYYDGPGSDESYVQDTGNGDVRSEGMSYGMMTAVQLDRQTEFDRLWAWVLNHMAQGTGEIAWQCTPSGSKLSNGGAPDGEEYMATALIFAHNRWGDTGRFDYASEAQWVLDLIRTRYFNSTYHLVQFVSNSGNVDASYVLPAFYQVWACFDTENADFWNESVSAGREFFHAAADSNGVIGDRQTFTGDTLQGAGSDAKRCVMNIMMDHNFFAADPWQVDTYAPAFGAYTYNDMDSAQLACNGLLGFALADSSGQHFVDNLWSAPIPTGTWRYYAGTLHMLALLHVSGTFQLWY